jgi:ABC-type nitrate/sulfonate/bicarbonate transport system substrate-binding protein
MYRAMDWMNAEISHALLVFRKDFIEEYPKEVQNIITAYMKRIKYENSIPKQEKISSIHPENNLGLQLGFQLNGSSIPVYDYPPLVRVELLEEVQDLLFEYGEIDNKIDLNQHIDNSFVIKALNNI